MKSFRPAQSGARYEIQSIGRDLDDLGPAQKVTARPGGLIRPLIWVGVTLIALITFIGWLLVGPPLPH